MLFEFRFKYRFKHEFCNGGKYLDVFLNNKILHNVKQTKNENV